MVTWFFENNQFANAWIPFDRNNQKKLEYVYRHHEELINYMLQQEQQLEVEQQQQQDNNNSSSSSESSNCSNISYNNDTLHKQDEEEGSLTHNNKLITTAIKNIDLEEEDASIHQFVKYDHNCIFIHLNDSHFEHEITLYPAMLLGSLPDRDILIVRTEMMDNKNKYLDV